MEFVEAVQLVYDLANGMELIFDEEAPGALQTQAGSQSEALDIICEWLAAQRAG
jgi:hypothetical protein